MKPNYVFRQASTKDDMISLFQMRHHVYQRLGYSLQRMSPYAMDIDEWDRFSTHYVLVLEEGQKETVIGGIRLVDQKLGPLSTQISRWFSYYFEYHQISDSPPSPLPCMSYAMEVERKITNMELHTEQSFLEASRLVLSPEKRGQGLANFMVANLFAKTCFVDHRRYAVAYVIRSHQRLYERFGAHNLAVSSRNVFNKGVADSVLLLFDKKSLPKPMERQLYLMAKTMRKDFRNAM